jgi:hypothetical protein
LVGGAVTADIMAGVGSGAIAFARPRHRAPVDAPPLSIEGAGQACVLQRFIPR